MLFPGKMTACMTHLTIDYDNPIFFAGTRGTEDGETLMGGRASGSPSFMKSVFGAGWGRRGTQGLPPGQPGPIDPRFQISPEQLDPYLRGAKQVIFSPPKKREIFWRMSYVT